MSSEVNVLMEFTLRCYAVSTTQQHTIQQIYGNLARITTVVRQRRLKLAGHVTRHNEPARKLIAWRPDPQDALVALMLLSNLLLKRKLVASERFVDSPVRAQKWKEDFVKTSPNG